MTFTVENKEEYFQHLDSLPVAIVIADAESGTILYVNSNAEKLWMRDASDLVGSSHTTLHPSSWNSEEYFARGYEKLKLKQERDTALQKHLILRSDGKIISAEITASMIQLDGKDAMLGSFVSVERREDAYREIQAKEEEISAIFENSQVGIMYLQGGRFLHRANQRLADILGYESPEEMQGISMQELHLSEERFKWW